MEFLGAPASAAKQLTVRSRVKMGPNRSRARAHARVTRERRAARRMLSSNRSERTFESATRLDHFRLDEVSECRLLCGKPLHSIVFRDAAEQIVDDHRCAIVILARIRG